MTTQQLVGAGGVIPMQDVHPGGGPNIQPQKLTREQKEKQTNRFIANRADAFADSAVGLSNRDLLKFQSGGQTDWTKRVKLQIGREFWRDRQVSGIFAVGLGIGLVAASLTLIFDGQADYDLFSNRGLFLKLSVLSLTLGLTRWWMKSIPHSNRQCDPYDPNVDPELRGWDCLADDDCTRDFDDMKAYSSCKYPHPGKFGQLVNFVANLLLIGGLIFLILNRAGVAFADAEEATPSDIYISAFIGFGFGTILSYVGAR